MINDFASSFTSQYPALARQSAHGSSGRHEARGRRANYEGARFGFTASSHPEIGSLWSPGMLDRLKAPLTRFHE
ncbi:MAG TPA: hypothetical protein VN775_03475 [Opitutaceae bacterium]|nr:hypothetical protein [Opitutaceae bacterium]